jgi:predicted DNA-binding protein (MmcQ/YjbR family)
MKHDRKFRSEAGLALVEQVRRECAAYPEAEEGVDGFGHTNFKVRGKSFIIMGETDGLPGLSFKSDRETQHLLQQQHDRYFKTPYIGHHGWVSINPDVPIQWDELRVLLREAYLRAAPKRLAKQLLEQDAAT